MVTDKIVLSGHIFDSLTLPKVLDEIIEMGGDYYIEEFEIGRTKKDTSRALIEVSAPDKETLTHIMTRIKRQGAVIKEPHEAARVKAGRNIKLEGEQKLSYPEKVRQRDTVI